MKNDDELENIIRRKDFASLTSEEKVFVLQTIGSEEEYEALRRIELAISDDKSQSTLEPRGDVLRSLHQHMENVSGKFEWSAIFKIKIPAYAAAVFVFAISILIYLLRPEVPAKYVVQEKSTVPAVRIDTIYVTKTDTVVRERIVYRQVNIVSSPPILDPATLVHQKQAPSSGVSMKEKEDLNKLLVSGSD